MKNPICFALDVPSYSEAQSLVDKLEDHVGAFKVGLELFISSGKLPITKKPIVLDLKLHDIPETIERAVKASCDLGVKYLTLHIQQEAAMLKAIRAAESYDTTLLGVTVLTSISRWDIKYRVVKLARLGKCCGIDGFVCSADEALDLRRIHQDSFLLVPGIRLPGAVKDDQKRTATPKEAIQNGANMIVVGRPIRDAENQIEAAEAILRDIQ